MMNTMSNFRTPWFKKSQFFKVKFDYRIVRFESADRMPVWSNFELQSLELFLKCSDLFPSPLNVSNLFKHFKHFKNIF